MTFNKLRHTIYFGLAVCVGGCGDTEADLVQKQVGRFASVEPREGFPPLVIDTATGCVMAVTKDEAGGVTVDEVNFPDGTTSCHAMKQLLVDVAD